MATRLLTPAARPVLLALLAALAWLVWGAGTAQAATPAADAGALVQPAGPPAPVQSVPLRSVPLPAPPEVPGAANTAVAPASAIVGQAADNTEALAAEATPIVSGTSATVSGLAPTLPELPLVQAPLPLPLPGILPLPEQLPALLSVPVPLPGVIPLPTPVPGVVPGPAPSGPASNAASNTSPDAGTSAADIPQASAGGAVSNPWTFGFAPARDLAGSAARAAAAAGPYVPAGPQGTPGPLRTSAVPVHAGHPSSGSFGGFGSAADIGGSWPAFPTAAGAANRTEADTLPLGPSFDPGSTPD